jgi:hypothetical protein
VWRQIDKISRLTGTNPGMATALSAALLMGIGARSYQRIRDRYKTGLNESAQMAIAASAEPADRTHEQAESDVRRGWLFWYWSSGDRLKEALNAQDKTPGERWFEKANHLIPFNHKEFDIPSTAASKRNPPTAATTPPISAMLPARALASICKTFNGVAMRLLLIWRLSFMLTGRATKTPTLTFWLTARAATL